MGNTINSRICFTNCLWIPIARWEDSPFTRCNLAMAKPRQTCNFECREGYQKAGGIMGGYWLCNQQYDVDVPEKSWKWGWPSVLPLCCFCDYYCYYCYCYCDAYCQSMSECFSVDIQLHSARVSSKGPNSNIQSANQGKNMRVDEVWFLQKVTESPKHTHTSI